jgi:hypothetical protein
VHWAACRNAACRSPLLPGLEIPITINQTFIPNLKRGSPNMIATLNQTDRYQNLWDDDDEAGGRERFRHRSHGEYPVRSQTARTRAKMRSFGGAAARRKARAFNGVNRRGRSKYSSVMRCAM